MATLSDLYTHLKTLCEQWFYNKSTMDTYLGNKIDKSSTSGLVKNDGSIDTNTYSTTSHTHGNISSDGKVGSNANYFVYTGTGGAVTSKQKIGNITTNGSIGGSGNLPIITTTNGVLTVGSFGTGANTFCEGNDSRLSDARTPTAHNQASSTITESSALANIGTSANATQHTINDAINTKIGELVNIDFVTVVTTLPTASASTMGKIYLVAITGSGDNNYAEYITVRSGTSPNYTYAWEKFGEISGSGLSVDWNDITSKPSDYPPSSHTHGQITNDGKITSSEVTVASGDNIVITDASDSSKIKRVATLLASHIIDGNAYSNIGTLSYEKQININQSIDTALGNKISKSQTTGLVKNDGTIDTTTYLSSLPSHSHGNILNGGTCTTDVTFNSKILVTNSSNQIGTSTAIDVLDSVVQSLISYGTS